ncbi:MAG TPA: hypothetical protein VGH27_00500 [Streptosporangiaceae bacterium]|jgi:hypothetical protein
MRGERGLLRLGERLVGRSCRHLPREARDERGQEWAAELPAILRDSGTRFALMRAVRMLRYAAGTRKAATALAPASNRRADWVLRAAIITDVAVNGDGIWLVFKNPTDWVPYAGFGETLLVCAMATLVVYRRARRRRRPRGL